MAPNGVMGTCFKDCLKDDDCFSRGHKCCSTGCGYMCMDVYTGIVFYFKYEGFSETPSRKM